MYTFQTNLFQVNVADGEPFANEHDDGSAEPVDAALVQTADAGHLAEVLGAGAAKEPFIPGDKKNVFI